MKKIILIVIFFCFALALKAQQDPQFSQNMFNILAVNPAYAGSEKSIVISAINRRQWVGFDRAPVTSLVNASMPIQIGRKFHGFGLSIARDELGFEKNTNVKFSYSYQKKLNKGLLHLGLSIGLQNNSLKGEWFVPDGDEFSSAQEDLGSGVIDAGKMVFDPGLGIFYQNSCFYAGLSVTHITKPDLSYSETVKMYLARHYYATAGYQFELSENWEILPSFFFKTDAVISQVDANCLLRYNKKLWAGVSYRINDAIVSMLGVRFSNGIQIGYAYDISTSKIAKASHEFLLMYKFKAKLEDRNQRYKSVRFL